MLGAKLCDRCRSRAGKPKTLFARGSAAQSSAQGGRVGDDKALDGIKEEASVASAKRQ